MQNATKNSFWYLTFNISRMLVVFWGTMWVSRVLGPTQFGYFSYLLSIYLYVVTLDSMCHESVVKKYFSEGRSVEEVLGSASLLCGIIAILSGLLIAFFAYFFLTPIEHLWALLFFLPGILSRPLNPIAHYFDSQLLSKYSSLALFSGAIFSVTFRIFSLNFTQNLTFQSLGYAFQFLICGSALYIFYKKLFQHSSWRISTRMVLDIAKKSLPIFISTVLFISLTLSDILMIQHILGAEKVGIYSVVIRLSEPWVIISSALCTSLFPLVFKYASNKTKQNKLFIRANRVSALCVLFLGLSLSATIELIVSILLGPEYTEVSSIFRLYFWSILFLFWNNIQHIWEVFHGYYELLFYKTLAACALKLALNYYLGSKYGLYGFAWATLIAYFFYGLGFNFFSKRTRHYLTLQSKSLYFQGIYGFYRFLRLKGLTWKKRES